MANKYVIKQETGWGGGSKTVIKREYTASEIGTGLGMGLGAAVGVFNFIRGRDADIAIKNITEAVYVGNFEEAIRHSSFLVKLYPKDAYSYALRARSYFGASNYDAAIRDVTTSIQIDESRSEFFALRGQCYLQQNNLSSALRDFTMVTHLDPTLPDGYIWRGITLREIDDLDQALINHNKAVELSPHEVTYRERAITYATMGNFQQAVADMSRVIALSPGSSEDLKLRAEFYQVLGDVEKSAADLQHASQIDEEAIRKFEEQEAQKANIIPGMQKGTWQCSSCSGFVRSDATFCKHCMKQFRPQATAPGELGASSTQNQNVVLANQEVQIARVIAGPKQGNNDTWQCSACMGYVRKDATFCKHCRVSFAV